MVRAAPNTTFPPCVHLAAPRILCSSDESWARGRPRPERRGGPSKCRLMLPPRGLHRRTIHRKPFDDMACQDPIYWSAREFNGSTTTANQADAPILSAGSALIYDDRTTTEIHHGRERQLFSSMILGADNRGRADNRGPPS